MTWEPLSNIIADEPTLVQYMPKNLTLLNTQGWKQLKKHAGTAKRVLELLINPSTDKLRHQADISMNGKFPRDYRHALQLDVQNGNIKWRDAIDLEIEQIKEYQVLKDHDKAVYAKNKVIHAPKEQNETVYSGVDSLRNLRLAVPC